MDYPSSFDLKVEFHIREREPSSLEEMQNIAVTVEYNIKCREERLKVAKKDWAELIAQIYLENKLEKLIETASSLLNIEEEEYEVETGNDDWKRPVACPRERQTRSLQDRSHMPNMHDEPELESENELADYFEERRAESLEDLMGDNTYNYDFSDVDLSDDNFFRRGTELARPSLVDSWEEYYDHQLQESDESM